MLNIKFPKPIKQSLIPLWHSAYSLRTLWLKEKNAEMPEEVNA